MRGCAKDGKSAAFQRIVFLIRNWEYKDEHDYGERGGQAYLDTYFDVINNEGKVKETDERHQKIRQCFSKFECYLMPHPGMKVTNANFDGRLSGKKSIVMIVPICIYLYIYSFKLIFLLS